MPLDEHLPVLDDHTYDSIITEMRSRIARYTPEWKPVWTDFNDSDPGITMLQVFAWLGEMLAYRMNQVPTLAYLKFLQLLGIELRPAEPASAQITFPVRPTATGPVATVPKGTQVIAETPGGGAPLVFEADRALVCLKTKNRCPACLRRPRVYDVTAADADATGYQPFGPTANAGSALLIGFDAGEPFPGTEMTFYVWAAQPGARGAAGHLRPSGQPGPFASATLSWQYWDGYDWSPLTLLKDETASHCTRSGEIIVRTPPTRWRPQPSRRSPPAGTGCACSVDRSQYERPPSILAIRTEHDDAHPDGDRPRRGARREQRPTRTRRSGSTQTPVLAGPQPHRRPG